MQKSAVHKKATEGIAFAEQARDMAARLIAVGVGLAAEPRAPYANTVSKFQCSSRTTIFIVNSPPE